MRLSIFQPASQPKLRQALVAAVALFISVTLHAADFNLPDLGTAESSSSAQTSTAPSKAESIVRSLPQNGDWQAWVASQNNDWLDGQLNTAFPVSPQDHNSASEALEQSFNNTTRTLFADATKDVLRAFVNGEQPTLNENTLLNSALSGLSSGGEAVLSYSDIAFLSNLEIEVGKTEGDKWDISLNGLQPLWSSDNNKHHTFMQAGIEYFERFDKQRTSFNVGLGYRQLSDDENYYWGTNIFFDHENPYDHQRMSVGLELETSLFRANSNIYQALTNWQDSTTHYQERALDGIDIEASGLIPYHPQWRVGLRGYQWNRYENESDIEGVTASLEYQHSQLFGFKISADDNNTSDLTWSAKLAFNYRPGVPLAQQWRTPSEIELLSVKNRLFRKVERENRIRVQQRLHKDIIAVVTTDIGNNTANGNAVHVNDYVYIGTTYATEDTADDSARLFITFNNGGVLEIGDASTAIVKRDEIELVSGIIRYTSNGATTVLTSPSATVTLSGTVVEFFEEGGQVVSRVTEGSIAMTVAGSTINLSAGGNENGCSSGAAPVVCGAGNFVYERFASAVNDRLDGNADTFEAPPMTTINAAGQSFDKGCNTNNTDANCQADEQIEHAITFANSFEIGTYEVTWDDYQKCVDDGGCTTVPADDGYGQGTRPQTNVSWNDITNEYIPWLNAKTGLTYRLPTESEWEYVARAGSNTVYPWGNALGTNNANCNGCGDIYTNSSPVGSFAANAFGVYDIIGNAWEWTSDLYGGTYTAQGLAPTDGTAYTASGTNRVFRGGGWGSGALKVRSAYRHNNVPTLRVTWVGFRLARTL